jgi:hypothetical protein
MGRERSIWRDWRTMQARRRDREGHSPTPQFQHSYPMVWYPPEQPLQRPAPAPSLGAGLPKYSPALSKLRQAPKKAPEPVNDTTVEKMVARALSSFEPEADPTPALHLSAKQLQQLAEIEAETEVRIIEDIAEIDEMLNEELNAPKRPFWRKTQLPLSRQMIEQRRLDREMKERLGTLEPAVRSGSRSRTR